MGKVDKVASIGKYKIIAGVFGGLGASSLVVGGVATGLAVANTKINPVVKTYTIKFETNQGTAIADQKVNENEKGIEPASPKRLGYEFIGWYKDAQFQTKYDWTQPVTGDITLYAHYKLVETREQVTLTFDLNGGTLVSGETERLIFSGTELGAINIPNFTAPTGKVFNGWDISSSTKIMSNTTVTAQYIDAPTEDVYHTVNFCIDGTETFSGTGQLQLQVKDGTDWADVVADTEHFPVITNPGYKVSSYYIPALDGEIEHATILEAGVKITKGDGKGYIFNVNIHWEAESPAAATAWLVFTDLSSRKLSWTGTQSFEADSSKTWNELIAGITVQQEESVFQNWSINGTSLEDDTYGDKTLKEILDEIYGEGQWPQCVIVEPVFDVDPTYYKVTFTNNEKTKGSIAGTTSILASSSKTWRQINKPTIISKDGYSFLGWYDTTTKQLISDTSKLTKDITVEAKWEISLDRCIKITPMEYTEIQFTIIGSTMAFEYSTDYGDTWSDCSTSEPLALNEGQIAYIRASKDSTAGWAGNINIKFTEGNVYLDGSIMGLLSKDFVIDEMKQYQFQNLFIDSQARLYVSDGFLPCTDLADGCYKGMFSNCTNLIKAPELPATTLANYCYSTMFSGCSKLINAPSTLPAQTVVPYAYEWMFYGCTSLTTPPIFYADAVEQYSCCHMFDTCSNLSVTKTAVEGNCFFLVQTEIPADAVTSMFANTKNPTADPQQLEAYYYN